MLQAHAMVPEGAGGGSMYKRPKQGGPQVPDPSYTLPGLTPLPPGAAAEAAAGGRSPLAAVAAAGPAISPRAAAGAPAAAPVSGSDMQLTGTGEAQPQLQHAAVQASPVQQQLAQPQQRRQSLQPVAGRMAHAAAGPAVRPASAESQMHPAPVAGKQQQQRRQSAVPVRAPAAGAAAGGSRRVSAPPAPVDRELQFGGSTSTGPGQQALAPLPLEAVPEELPSEEAHAAGAAPQQAQHSPQQAQQQPASQATAAGAPLVRVTLSAVPQATPASVPAPPRELALSRLTGLTSTPLKGGIYEFTDPRYGYVFQLGPASPDSAGAQPGGCGVLCVWISVVHSAC